MRIRPIIVLSAVVLTGGLLAGCASNPDPSASPDETAASTDCGLNPQAGDDSAAVTVEGEAPALTATVPTDLAFSELQRTDAGGDGDDIALGQLVTGQYQVIDAATGEILEDSATLSAYDSGLVPIIVSGSDITGAAVLCTPLGSSAAMTIPGSMLGSGAANVVVVAQSVEQLPVRATGAEQSVEEGFPGVEFADDGAPTVTIPGGEAPGEVQLTNLKVGDGVTVEPGDTVTVQYTGVKWSDGSVFDSSWERGAPAAFPTTGVVEGFKQALEGQAVGSQVLVVIPPAAGYGEGEINSENLVGETLVFVVDILGTQRTAAA